MFRSNSTGHLGLPAAATSTPTAQFAAKCEKRWNKWEAWQASLPANSPDKNQPVQVPLNFIRVPPSPNYVVAYRNPLPGTVLHQSQPQKWAANEREAAEVLSTLRSSK